MPVSLSRPALSRLVLQLLILLSIIFTLSGEAQAHAALVSTDPPSGAVLDRAPPQLELTFSEPVSPIVLKLVGPDGAPATLDAYHLEGNTLVITAPEGLEDGSYALSWRVTSVDGHPVGGSILFAIGAPSAGAPAVADAAADSGAAGIRPLIWITRVALYLGLFFGVGALPFHAFIAPAPPLARRVSTVMMVAGLISIPPAMGLQGLDMLGAPLTGLADPAVWVTTAGSVYFRTLLLAAIALGLGLAAWRISVSERSARLLILLAWACVGAALAASGHASSAHPQALTRTTVFVHASMIAAWAGSLLPFLLIVRSGGEPAQRMLRRFSTAILPIIILLILAGVVMARVQIGHPDALFTTAYGRVFMAKLGLLAILFGLAAFNRFRLTPRLARGTPKAECRFERSVRAEIVLICVILGVVGLWRFTPPPRALQAAEVGSVTAAAPVSMHLQGTKLSAHLMIDPGQVGQATATAFVMDDRHESFAPQEVTLSLANPAAGIEPIRIPMASNTDDSWTAGPLLLPVAGTWSVRLDILISDFETTKLEGEAEILP